MSVTVAPSIRAQLPLKNYDIVEHIFDSKNLDLDLRRALNTGIFFKEKPLEDSDDEGSGADDNMPGLEAGSVASDQEAEYELDGKRPEEVHVQETVEPRGPSRPVQSRPAPSLRRDPITEQVKQHTEHVARTEGKTRAARRRQREAEAVLARAERPEELFQREREERDRLRVEKGFVEDDEDLENPRIYTCCLKELQEDLEGWPKVNVDMLMCKYDEAESGIRMNAHCMRIDCEKGCEYRCHHPSCVRALVNCGLHSKEQPWGKMDAKNTCTQLSTTGIVMTCLRKGCGGRIVRTVIEKDKGIRRAEVWYHAKWHQDQLGDEERARKAKEEVEAKAREAAEELRKTEEKAAEIEAKKAAKQAAKAAKEAARRPDIVSLDGIQVPVPAKKPPRKPKGKPEAPKAELRKPDIQEVEKLIEPQADGSAAAAPRQIDDVFAGVPKAVSKKKDKRKEKKDKKKKVLDIEFGEADDEDTADASTGVDAQVERFVANRAQQVVPSAGDAGPSGVPRAPPRLAQEFPDLGSGHGEPGSTRAMLALLGARNFEERDFSTPVTPFILCRNLDMAALLNTPGLSAELLFKRCLVRHHVCQVRVFEDAACAAIEVGYHDGYAACKVLNGQLLGSKPVVASHLIEFPDAELMSALTAITESGKEPEPVIRYIVSQRRAARSQLDLPTFEDIQAAQTAAPGPPPVLFPSVEPKGKAAPSPPPVRATAPVALANPTALAGTAASAGAAMCSTGKPFVSSAKAPAAADSRTYEDSEKWLRSAENPNAGLEAIPQAWLGVTDLFVLSLRGELFQRHYMEKTAFVLDDMFFPDFKKSVAQGYSMKAALVFFERETGDVYGVMRMEPYTSKPSKVSCKPFIESQPKLRRASTSPPIPTNAVAELRAGARTAQHYVSSPAWKILHAFSVPFGLQL